MILFEGIVKTPMPKPNSNEPCFFSSIWGHLPEWIVRVKRVGVGDVGDGLITEMVVFEGDPSLSPFVQDFLRWLVCKGMVLDVSGGYQHNEVVFYYNYVTRGRLEKLAMFKGLK